jgi:hypothetical protein
MIKQGRGGRIIGMYIYLSSTWIAFIFQCNNTPLGASSIWGKGARASTGAYSASKFAIRGLTQSAG